MTGYTRQSIAEIAADEEIKAEPLNAEFNALATAFSAISGHAHDGTSGSGPKISLTSSVTGNLPMAHIAANVITKDKLVQSPTKTVLGNMTASTANVDNVSVLDEDNMVSNSATALATQQSIKAYVDALDVAVVAALDDVVTYVDAQDAILEGQIADIIAGGGLDNFYTSRANAQAASPTSDIIFVLHGERLLTYKKADVGRANVPLVTADSQKWEPCTELLSPLHWGAVGDGTTDDWQAIQTMTDYLVDSASNMQTAWNAGRTWTVKGYGRKYAISKPWMMGNLGTGTGLVYYCNFEDLHFKAIQGAYNWSTTYGGANEIPSRMLIMAWQLNADASDNVSGFYKVSFHRCEFDCNFITGGIFIQNSTQLSFRDVNISYMGPDCHGFQTSIGNSAQNARGYRTINGALMVDNMNVQGYVEETGNTTYPGGRTQDTMGTRAFDIHTNDARYNNIICSRTTYSLYIDNCGAIQFDNCHPWSRENYIGQYTNNLMFSNCYFDYTKTVVDCGTTGNWNHYFNACHWILGGSDRSLVLRTGVANTTADGLIINGCRFKGDANDFDIVLETTGAGSWVSVENRKYMLTGTQFASSSSPEAYFKASKYLTINATTGNTVVQTNDVTDGQVSLDGNAIYTGLNRTVDGASGLWMQWDNNSSTGLCAIYAGSTGNLLQEAPSGNEIVFGVEDNYGVSRIKSDGAGQIYGLTGVNAAAAGLKVGRGSLTRSINAGGTINASGADYAEYHRVIEPLWGNVTPGTILGFNAEGTLTNVFADVVGRFVVKSTNPNLVGGDSWGEENSICMKYNVEPPHMETDEGYEERLSAFNEALEQERIQWDRIAKCGYVPVNIQVTSFDVGKYLIPADDNGNITAVLKSKAELTLVDYIDSFGIVLDVLEDGRALVEVKIN